MPFSAMYNIADYRWMMEDDVRVSAYMAALKSVVRPGDVVVDLGAGVGTWAFICCQLGARKVYAIEMSPSIHIGKRIAAANGFADKVEFIHEYSTAVNLPEKANVIVFDIHGQQPIFENSLTSIIDARKRFLHEGGTLVPYRETLWASVVEDSAAYQRHVGFWGTSFHGIDMRPAKTFATDWRYGARFSPENLVTKKFCYAELDYQTLEEPELITDFRLKVERHSTGHGLYLWFDSDLFPGIGFTNAPGSPEMIFGGTFLPWPDPVALDPEDEIRVSLAFRLVNGEFVWSWTSRIFQGEHAKAHYSQSTLKHYLPKLPTFDAAIKS